MLSVAVSGYAAIFGSVIAGRSAVRGSGNVTLDTFAPGAFRRAIARHKAAGTAPAMCLNHDLTTACCGRWISFEEDERGLRMTGVIDLRSQEGNAALGMLRLGMLNGFSFGRADGTCIIGAHGIAVITEADLNEVSLVQDPTEPLALIDGTYWLASANLEMTRLQREAAG